MSETLERVQEETTIMPYENPFVTIEGCLDSPDTVEDE